MKLLPILNMFDLLKIVIPFLLNMARITVKPVYKGHSRKPEYLLYMSSCPLYTG